ncbi:MAG: hypothetical protein LBV07_04135, partial [Syntrophobacterales bacterium]|nr:hypothetical protein [Syntrophobacterales bacterium]
EEAEKSSSLSIQSFCRELEKDGDIKTLFCPSAEKHRNAVHCVCLYFPATESSVRDISSGSVAVLSEKDGLSLLISSRKRISFLSKTERAGVSCIVFTAGQTPCREIADFCKKHHIALLASSYDSHYIESRIKRIIREHLLKTTVCHGAFLQIYGSGVLITGDAGSGKTTCALTLAQRGHVWIADDLVEITAKNAVLRGKAYGPTRNLAAFRGHDGITIETLENIAYTQDEATVDLWCELRKNMEGQMYARKRLVLEIALPFCCFPSPLEVPDVSFFIENWVKSFAFEREKIS